MIRGKGAEMTPDQFLRRINLWVHLPILVVSSLLLSACQPFHSVYLQNYDTTDVVVTLVLHDSVLLDHLTSVDDIPRVRTGLPSPGEFSPGDFHNYLSNQALNCAVRSWLTTTVSSSGVLSVT